MKKILFTDMDGTLLNDDSKVSEFTKNVLHDISMKGHVIVLSSGRSIHSILDTASKLDIIVPGMFICAANGAMIYECDTDKVLYYSPVSLEDVKNVWNMARQEHIHIQTYSDKELLVSYKSKEVDYYMIRCPHPLVITDAPWEILKKPPVKLLAIDLEDHEKLDRFGKEVSDIYPHLNTLFSNPMYLEIISKEAGKGHALKWLCNYLNIPISLSYAAGDQFNDASMIKAAGTGIAMCNGDTAIFEFADILSEFDNNHDGLSQYIVKEFI
ncbi:MAG: HAD family phosphatase [Lachnospiraceae bacterium]|nr:HAD family phosphatase [Lachnospiraceae bacterium]